MEKMKKQPLLNIYVNNLNWKEVMDSIKMLVERDMPSYIIEVNVDVLVKIEKDPQLKQITDQADLVLVDGKPLMWIAQWQKNPVKAKISGSDLVQTICEEAQKEEYSVFIVGGRDGASIQAADNMRAKYPGIRIVGTYEPPLGFEQSQEEVEQMNQMILRAKPDILFACLGCPKQEKWVYENHKKYGAKVSLCAGASVDFMAGRVRRAPKWMREHGLEWLYRFLMEPRRLFKRYFIDDMKIVFLMWRYRRR